MSAIAWTVQGVKDGPLIRTRVGVNGRFADGVVLLTIAEYGDLRRRLGADATPAYPCIRCGAGTTPGAALCSACEGSADLHEGVHALVGDAEQPVEGVELIPLGRSRA